MRDKIVWKPCSMATEKYGHRTVYVKHWAVPFYGLMAASDTAFTIPAFIRLGGKRITGFITPRDGMAYQQDHDGPWFVAHSRHEAKS